MDDDEEHKEDGTASETQAIVGDPLLEFKGLWDLGHEDLGI